MRGGTQIALGCLLCVLAACTAAPPAPPDMIAITFQHREPISLRVATVDVVDRYEPSLQPPNVEHLHRVTPAQIVRRWAAERLQPTGSRGHVTLIVEEAGVVEHHLAVTDGMGGLFRDEPDTRLAGTIRARFDHVDVGPPAWAHSVEIVAEASAEILESATLNDRDLAYLRLVERLAGEFDRVLTEEIERSLATLIDP